MSEKICYLSVDFEEATTIPYLGKYNFKSEEFGTYCDKLGPFFGKLKENNLPVTIFVIGAIASRYADFLKKIAPGNVFGCHSLHHDNLKKMTTEEFIASTKEAKSEIENALGQKIHGYRAPFFSANMDKINSLADMGFSFDSSYINSSSNEYYEENDFSGWKTLQNGVYENPDSGTIEYELPTVKFLGKNIPLGGGGFFRLMPFWLYKHLLKKYFKAHNVFVFFMHPYEIFYQDFSGLKKMSFKDKIRFDINRKGAQKKMWKTIAFLKKEGFAFKTMGREA